MPALSPEKQLRRSVLSCLLWEDTFYEDGVSIAERIAQAAMQVDPDTLAKLAIEARSKFNLRHVPLLLLCALSKSASGIGVKLVAETVAQTIQRPDELTELLAVYWAATPTGQKRKMVPHQMAKGLAAAFKKFNEYNFAKYDRDGVIKLRDVLRLVRPKPDTDEQSALFKRIKDRTLATPDTWEVELSGGKDKKATFERLIREHKLGYFALLPNLRNMTQAGVDAELVHTAIIARKGGAERILPFRYIAAARAAPQFEPSLDKALQAAIAEMEPLRGSTFVLVDVSGSMDGPLSAKSDMRRVEAAATLGAIIPSTNKRVFSFSHNLVEVPPRVGMGGVDAIIRSQPHASTYLGAAVAKLNEWPHDRLIVVTDEQAHDAVEAPKAKHAYLINVGSYKNGVGYGRWTHIDGFSEQVIRFIREVEAD